VEEVAVGVFEDLHRDRITGSLAMFDRMIFKGYLTRLYPRENVRCFLWTQGVALKDFTAYAKATTERIANDARKLVTDAGRPVISFDHVKTRHRAQRKDELAKAIVGRDGITAGIVCLISAVEPCMSFQVRKGMKTGRLEATRRERKCLHHYLYLIDPSSGSCTCASKAGSRMSVRSTSTAGSGWPTGSTNATSARSATTTRW